LQPVGFTAMAAMPVMTEPWFVIQAARDRDADGVFALAAATSWNNDVYIENDTE